MKKLLCNTLIIIIMLGVFCNGYFGCSGLSFYDRFSYAEADNWDSCDSSDLVTAFRYYCKSRNLVLDGSVADALTSFTTTTFNNICSTLGIDPTELQAELKKTTDGNLGLRFLFSNTGITAYNRIFAEFLQNNNLAVGDSVDNEVVESGKWLQVTENSGCYLFVLSSVNGEKYTKSQIVTYGSPYLRDSWSGLTKGDVVSWSFTYGTRTYPFRVQRNTNSAEFTVYTPSGGTKFSSTVYWRNEFDAYISYCILNSDNSIRVLTYDNLNWNSTYKSYSNVSTPLFYLSDLNNPPEDTDITINTPGDTVINNNTYNNNYVIIYNEGDTYVSDGDDEPSPDTPPGSDDPFNPDPNDPLDPYDPTKPFPDSPDNPTPDPGVHGSPGSDGTITIPDFNFDLPDINWSLDGLQHKFPFSLPFDLYNACKLLNAEPQTPELDYTVDLVVYQWPVQMDLHWLDSAARVIRIFELLAFVVGLILITRHLIGG